MSDFSPDRAAYLHNIAQMPLAYEQGGEESVQQWKPSGINDSDIKIIQHGSSTAVIVHDKISNEVIVSFDGSLEDTGDYIDDLTVWPTDHPNGGEVRSGFMNGVMRENDQGEYLADVVKDSVLKVAQNSKEPVDLSFTGFSKGGAMAELTASNWLSERFPESGDNLKMNEVYTFGSPPLGDKEFAKNFEGDMERQGMTKFRVDFGRDSVPKFTMGVMEQVGDQVLLVPDDKFSKTTAVLNPNEALKDQLNDTMPDDVSDWHNVDGYKAAIDKIDGSVVNDPAVKPISPNSNPDLAQSNTNVLSMEIS